MTVPAVLVLLILTALAVAAATLSKQEEFLDAVHTSTRMASKYRIIEDLLKSPEVDPGANENEPFLYAVRNDDFFVVQVLLNNERVDPGANNNAALKTAVARSNYSMIVLLLSSDRVDPADVRNGMDIAIAKEDTLAMRILLDDSRTTSTEKAITFILVSAVGRFKGNTKPFSFLFNHLKFDGQDYHINRVLAIAVTENKLDLVKWFLAQPRVDPTFKENYAFRIAVHRGQHDIVQCFLESGRVDAGLGHNLALLIAIGNRDRGMVEMLLNNEKVDPNDRDGTFVMAAVEQGDHVVLETLLSKVENPSANGNIALRLALKKKDSRMVRMLLAHPNINVIIPTYHPPVYDALETGDMELIRAVVEHPKFSEGTEQVVMDRCLEYTQRRQYVEIGNYLRTVKVNGDVQSRPQTFSQPLIQLAWRMKILHGLIFWTNPEAQLSIVFDSQFVLSKLSPLLEQVFTTGASSSAGRFVELLRLSFSDYRTFNGRQLEQENMIEAFKSFAMRDLVGYYDSRGTGRPADFKRRREDGPPAAGGEQESTRVAGESSSSRMSSRNVRRRLDSDVHDEEDIEESDGARGVEAGKEPEDA